MARSAKDAKPVRARRSDGEVTRARVIDATVASILEKGYYQTSSNEIARRAGVTWGTIQHQFGTREALLLEVMNDRWHQLEERIATAEVVGATLEERLRSVFEILTTHYGSPEHLAHLQILLDLSHDPKASGATRDAVRAHGTELVQAWQPLFAQALGEAASDDDAVLFAFLTLRGYLTANLIAASIATTQDHTVQRELLIRGVAASIRERAARRGISLA